ncbi:hypothetical protein CDD83_433 [Cordyceps sp. RAO-2017]|nr:hypothetical protein CDD83_433 [Cordyceps sp. RAO-2017]
MLVPAILAAILEPSLSHLCHPAADEGRLTATTPIRYQPPSPRRTPPFMLPSRVLSHQTAAGRYGSSSPAGAHRKGTAIFGAKSPTAAETYCDPERRAQPTNAPRRAKHAGPAATSACPRDALPLGTVDGRRRSGGFLYSVLGTGLSPPGSFVQVLSPTPPCRLLGGNVSGAASY